jgi:hypothetical protein
MPRRNHFPNKFYGHPAYGHGFCRVHPPIQHIPKPELITAILSKDEKEVERVLKSEAKNINRLYGEKPPLDHAIHLNHLSIVTLLLKKGGKSRDNNKVKKFLMEQDQRDENVQLCIHLLLEDPKLKEDKDLLSHKRQLSELHIKTNKKIEHQLLQHTPLPKTVVGIVCQYGNSLNHYIFFKGGQLKVLLDEEPQKSKTQRRAWW